MAKKYKYRVKHGRYRHGGVTYERGQIVESEKDLVKRFGEKFAYVGERPPDHEEDDAGEGEEDEDGPDLDGMTIQQLRDFAERNEIDLEGATRKDEIVQTIRAHLDLE